MKSVKFISDNTPESSPNILRIIQRDDGDIEISISTRHEQERGISIRANGSRLKSGLNYKVIKLFSEIIDMLNGENKEEIDDFAELIDTGRNEEDYGRGFRCSNCDNQIIGIPNYCSDCGKPVKLLKPIETVQKYKF